MDTTKNELKNNHCRKILHKQAQNHESEEGSGSPDSAQAVGNENCSGVKKIITFEEFSEGVALRKIDKMKEFQKYKGQVYDFTQMRKVYTSQNRNSEIAEENAKSLFTLPKVVKYNNIQPGMMRLNTKTGHESDNDDMSNMSPGLKHLSREDSLSPSPFGKGKLSLAIGSAMVLKLNL